jgi:hypothetical protein
MYLMLNPALDAAGRISIGAFLATLLFGALAFYEHFLWYLEHKVFTWLTLVAFVTGFLSQSAPRFVNYLYEHISW